MILFAEEHVWRNGLYVSKLPLSIIRDRLRLGLGFLPGWGPVITWQHSDWSRVWSVFIQVWWERFSPLVGWGSLGVQIEVRLWFRLFLASRPLREEQIGRARSVIYKPTTHKTQTKEERCYEATVTVDVWWPDQTLPGGEASVFLVLIVLLVPSGPGGDDSWRLLLNDLHVLQHRVRESADEHNIHMKSHKHTQMREMRGRERMWALTCGHRNPCPDARPAPSSSRPDPWVSPALSSSEPPDSHTPDWETKP